MAGGRHGRATLPWGRFRGVRIRLVPDDYLSWLTTSAIVSDPKWGWLKESLLAELRHRGLRADLVDDAEMESGPVESQQALALVAVVEQRPRRAYSL